MTEKNTLKRGILTILVTNIINMVFKVFIYLFQPKFLSIETYAMIQTFTLYFSYAGLLHFGYVDGMYLKLGGKYIYSLNKKSLINDASTLRGVELIVVVILLISSLIFKNTILFFVSIALLPSNLTAYYRMMFQATGEFNKYGRIMNFNTLLLFVYNFILIVVLKIDNYIAFLTCEVLVYFLIWLFLEYNFRKLVGGTIGNPIAIKRQYLIDNVRNGLPLTLGNLASNFFSSLDRWFVKILLSTSDFAYYSFAVSVETFLNVAITPVTITLYNYFCQHGESGKLNKIKNMVIILAVFVVAAVFPAKFILEHFMQNYFVSFDVLLILFAAKIFSVIIQGVYVNMYKATRRQNIYLKKLIICIVIGAILNILAYFLTRANYGFSIATFITIVIWFIMCKQDFKQIVFRWREISFLFFMAGCLVLCGKLLNSIIGLIIYIIVAFIGSRIIFPTELKYIVHEFFGKIFSKIKLK